MVRTEKEGKIIVYDFSERKADEGTTIIVPGEGFTEDELAISRTLTVEEATLIAAQAMKGLQAMGFDREMLLVAGIAISRMCDELFTGVIAPQTDGSLRGDKK